MKKLLVIDGNSILNRAFYGVRPLTNSAGLHTNALFGMLNILLKQLGDLKPDYAAIAYDLKAPTFRHKLYDKYKAGRKGMPEELAVQLPYSKKMSELLGLHVITLEGYEADDLLGTVSEMAKSSDEEIESYVLTGDRDSLQLISDKVSVLLATNSDTLLYNRDTFFEKYGIEPSQFVDVKALMGDSSDNIPGVPGIGEKTAFKLISEFGTLDAVYENIENAGLGKSAKQKMTDGRDLAYLSKELATIDKASPVAFTLSDLENKGFDRDGLYLLLQELEFTSHIKRLGLIAPVNTENAVSIAPENGNSDDNASVQGLTEGDGDQLSFDLGQTLVTEKDVQYVSLKDVKKKIKGDYALVYGDKAAAFCDSERCYEVAYTDISELCEVLSGIKSAPVLYDSKSFYNVISAYGCDITASDDVMLMAYVVDPARGSYRLEDLSEIYLKHQLDDRLSSAAMAVYGLKEALTERLEKNGMLELYRRFELPLALVLSDMEKAGFKLDTAALTEFLTKLTETEKAHVERIYELAGEVFNINSPKQLGEILFEKLGLPAGKKTKTGYSTNAEILEKLRGEHPVVAEILEYRAVAKLRSTYAEALLKVADENDRVHTVFSQTTAVTGRLASSDPNLQNIPVRTPLGREMRRFFIASDSDHVLIDADYSQIELRLLAHIARDSVMTDAFVSGEDIHAVTASQVFNVPLSEVTGEMRKHAKAVNFGIVYGIGEFSLAQDIGVSR